MKTLTLILMLALFKGCGEQKDIYTALDSIGIPSTAANLQYDYVTPGGVKVRSTQALPQVAIDAIDDGIRTQIARTATYRPQWLAMNSVDRYSVLVIEPTAYSEFDVPGAPLIQLRGGTTAGTVIGVGGTKSLDRAYIIVPHQVGQSWRFIDFFRDAVKNESEHVNECSNPDRNNPEPECDLFQGWKDVHPHQFP